MNITFKSVTKKYGLVTALNDVSFKIKKGDFVLLTGPSGSGKTTIFRLILGEIQPTSGQILIDKVDTKSIRKKDMDKIRTKIGVIFQDYQLIFDKTVEENINLALDIVNYSREDRPSKVDKVLQLVGLLERRYLFPSQLSGGELQRTSLARAIVINPDLILADEPTGNLDETNSQKILEIFEKINNQSGTTIIMATHNPTFINKLPYAKIDINYGSVISQPQSTPKLKSTKSTKIND